LTAQIRRSAVSVAANIAESCGRPSYPDQSRFLSIAVGSARETESHLLIAVALGFARVEDLAPVFKMLGEIERMLSGLIRRKKQMGRSA
jgi:four helix bundle protein